MATKMLWIDCCPWSPQSSTSWLLDLDRALEALAEVYPRLVRVVELRYFAGLTVNEAADVIGFGAATVVRDRRAARAFLLHHLTESKTLPTETDSPES